MKPRRFDLNDYYVVESEEDLMGKGGLIIVPPKRSDGTQLSPIYYLKKQGDYMPVVDIENTIWFEELPISNKGTASDYADRLDWWIDNALNDEEWVEKMQASYCRHGFDMYRSIEVFRNKYKLSYPEARPTHIKKRLNNWFREGSMMVSRRNK